MSGNKTFSKAFMDVLSGPTVLFDKPGPYFSYIPEGSAENYLGLVTSYIGFDAEQAPNEPSARRDTAAGKSREKAD
jgi:hypothetical protein